MPQSLKTIQVLMFLGLEECSGLTTYRWWLVKGPRRETEVLVSHVSFSWEAFGQYWRESVPEIPFIGT